MSDDDETSDIDSADGATEDAFFAWKARCRDLGLEPPTYGEWLLQGVPRP